MQTLKNLSGIQKLTLFALVTAIVILGTITVFRAALFTVSRTDLTVYLRAAQAIWNHENIYVVENARHWHYVYLPLLAILMTPFVFLPLWLNAALWYLLSVAAIAGTSLGIASFFENKNKRFWIPLACIILALPPLLNTFTRGQLGAVSLYLTLLPFLLDQKNKKFLAGFVLAFGIILKMSPLMILPFYFLLQKNWRTLLGCFVGGLVFGIALPTVVFGPELHFQYLKTYFTAIASGTGPLAHQSYLWGELFTPFAEDNQSFYAIATRLFWKTESLFWGHPNATIRFANLSFLVTLLSLITLAFFKSKSKTNFSIFALLSCVMLFTSPVTQPHHYTPLILLAAAAFIQFEMSDRFKVLRIAALVACLVCFALGMLIDSLAWIGLPFWGSLLLWISIFASTLLTSTASVEVKTA